MKNEKLFFNLRTLLSGVFQHQLGSFCMLFKYFILRFATSFSSRRGHRGPSYPRGPRDHEESSMYDSRPSSRAGPDYGGPRGGPYVDPYGYPRGGPVYPHMLHPHHMPPQPPVVSQSTQPPSLDQDKLNIFRRNWEYYSSNPKV